MAKDQPDALVWREDGRGHYLCAHCVTTNDVRNADSLGAAYRAAIAHLWRTHSMQRVWLDEHQPELSQAAQMALPLVMAHHTQFDRRW